TQLAHHMQRLGVARESIVGICIDRSLDMAVAIVATLKAGAAYLPLDPEYPRERLAFMLEDARPALVLTKANLSAGFGCSSLPAEEGTGVKAYDVNTLNPISHGRDGATRCLMLD